MVNNVRVGGVDSIVYGGIYGVLPYKKVILGDNLLILSYNTPKRSFSKSFICIVVYCFYSP